MSKRRVSKDESSGSIFKNPWPEAWIPIGLVILSVVGSGFWITEKKSRLQETDEYKASSFIHIMNAVCDDTKFDTLSLSGLFTDKSEHAEQVQSVYAFLLDTHRNDEDTLKKLLDFRDYISNPEWINRFVWDAVSKDSKILFLNGERRERMDKLGQQADALIRELNP